MLKERSSDTVNMVMYQFGAFFYSQEQDYGALLWGDTGPELRSLSCLVNGQCYNRRQGYAPGLRGVFIFLCQDNLSNFILD